MEFQKYIEKKILITPAFGKQPILNNWINIDDMESIKDKFKNNNFGLITGKKSGIVVLDIDATNEDLKLKILNVVMDYPTPIMRMGSKLKLPSMFYSYNGQDASKKISYFDIENGLVVNKVAVELLSNRLCILPPSIHNEGHQYAWLKESLCDFNLDYLPLFNDEMWKELEKVISDYNKKFDYHTKGIPRKTTDGRNNKLFDIISAMVGNGEPIEKVLSEVIEYDKNNHNPPWLTDASEPHGGDIEKSKNYIISRYNSLLKKEILKDSNFKIIDKSKIDLIFSDTNELLEENISEEIKREKLPRLLGIGQKMFEYMYSMSTTPKSHQVLSYIMSLSSVLMSNRYQLEGTFSNTYTLVFSESGGGKNEGQDFITALLEQSGMNGLIGERLAGGSTAMIMNLPEFRERIDIVSEGTRFFEAISSNKEYKSEMALIYSDLFNAGGKGFYNKSNQQEKKDNKGNRQGRIGECFSPCITLLITINMSSSKMLIKNKMYEQGFMARLNVRLDSDRKKRKPYGGSIVDNIPYEFISFIKSAGPIKRVVENKGVGMDLNTPEALKKFIVPEIPVDEDALKRIKEIEQEIIEMEYETKSDDMMLYVIRRAYENFKKNILCITPLSLSRLTDLKVSMKEVEWAWWLSKTDLNNHKLYLRKEMIDSKKELLMMKIFNIIKQGKKPTKSDVCRKIRGDKREREEAIADLKECGYIQEIQDNKTYFYKVLKNIEL